MHSVWSISAVLSPGVLWRWGRVGLTTGFALALTGILYLVWFAPELLPLIPATVLGISAGVFLFQRPLLNLGVVIAGFVLITNHTSGIQIQEVLYGLYVVAYLAHWLFTRLVLSSERIIERPEEWALLAFLAGVTLSWGLTFVFNGNPQWAFSEWMALSMLALYFPVKEALVRYPNGPRVVAAALLWIGLFVATRNLIEYQTRIVLSLGSAAGVTGKTRVMTNDNLLMAASMAGFIMVVFSRSLRSRVVSLGYFLLVFAGLVLTLSRTYWVAFAAGVAGLFLIVDSSHKKNILKLGGIGFSALLLVATLFFGDLLMVIVSGLVERLSTLQGSATKDLSLLSRIYESEAVLANVVQNPVLGHGLGVPYEYFDILTHSTVTRTFIHNGYISLLYRFGLFGLACVLFIWSCAAWRGIQAFKTIRASLLTRLSGLSATCILLAYTLSTITSNPFHLDDGTFIFGVLMGVACGAWKRTSLETDVSGTEESPDEPHPGGTGS